MSRASWGVVVLLILAGCSKGTPRATPTTPTVTVTSSGPGPSPTSSVATGSVTPTPTSTPLRITLEQAATLLLDPAGLPPGYQPDPDVDPDTGSDLPPGCPVLDAFLRTLHEAPVRAARGLTVGPTGPWLIERVAVLADAAQAQLDTLQTAPTACPTYTSKDSDGGKVTFTVARVTSGQYGDQTLALTVAGETAGSGKLLTALTVIRQGDTLVSLTHTGLDRLDPEVLVSASTTVLTALSKL